MISVKEALKIVAANQPSVRSEQAALAEAAGRVVAQDILAPEPSPRYTNSAMDGFAVRWSDVAATSSDAPVRLSVIGESQAGVPFAARVSAGKAVRINTGAMLPEGADSVVPIEDAQESGGTVAVMAARREHQHVRFRGSEFKTGEKVIEANTLINPSHIALLASLGVHEITVFARPRLSILVTGSELTNGRGRIEAWQIRDSNRPMLAASAEAAGAVLVATEVIGDDLDLTRSAVEDAARHSDIVVLSGGVSVGEHDFVKPAVRRSGFETLIWRIDQKPGKPLLVAKKGETLLFGLPGNPVSAMMCFLYYVYPAIRRFNGLPGLPPSVSARAAGDFANLSKRPQFLRVNTGRDPVNVLTAAPLERQGSHMLTSLTKANGFVFLQPGETVRTGEAVPVVLFPWSSV